MKLLKFFLVFACNIVMLQNVAIADTDEFPPLYGVRPNIAVKQWIKYLVLGPQNSPFPIVWIAPESFKIHGFPEFLVVLSPQEYEVVAKSTTAKIADADCGREWPKHADWYTVEISENKNGILQRCVIPKDSACRYFFDVLKLPVSWSSKQREPIDVLMRSIKCKTERAL